MEQSFGESFAGVKAYQGPEAQEAARGLGAKAYAVDEQIAFGAEPTRELVAHELTHVVQQRQGNSAVQAKGSVSSKSDSHEQEADRIGDIVAKGGSGRGLISQPATADVSLFDAFDILNVTGTGVGTVGRQVVNETGHQPLWQVMSESITRSPKYILADIQQMLKEHWLEIVQSMATFFAIEAGVVALMAVPDPTMGTKIAAILLQALVLALMVYFAVEATEGAAQAAQSWWDTCLAANSDPAKPDSTKIELAAQYFAGLILNLVTAISTTAAGLGIAWRGIRVPEGAGRVKIEGTPPEQPTKNAAHHNDANRLEPAAAESKTGKCFLPGTLVHTLRGPVEIEHVRVGDLVFGADTERTEIVLTTSEVTHVFVHEVTAVVELDFMGERITCTPEHPFHTVAGWRSAGSLTVDSSVTTREGPTANLRSNRRLEGRFKVHNIEVANVHDYFVGRVGLLVHNKAMRWDLKDRALALGQRAHQLVEEASVLPAGPPEHATLVREAEAVRVDADPVAAKAALDSTSPNSLEPSRSTIESLEQRIERLEAALDNASLLSRGRQLPHRVTTTRMELEKLPDSTPEKWRLIGELRTLEPEAVAIEELAEHASSSVSHLGSNIESIEAVLREADELLKKSKVSGPGAAVLPRPHLDYPANHLPTSGKHPYEPARQASNPEIVRHPHGNGYLDRRGNRWEWARDPHGGPHWDVQHPNGDHTNVYPDGDVWQGDDRF